jgi:hypothetical protein
MLFWLRPRYVFIRYSRCPLYTNFHLVVKSALRSTR